MEIGKINNDFYYISSTVKVVIPVSDIVQKIYRDSKRQVYLLVKGTSGYFWIVFKYSDVKIPVFTNYLDFRQWFEDNLIPTDTNQLLDINQLTDEDDLLSNCLVTTHAELKALRDDSELVVGQKYLITDFAQSYNIFDGATITIIEEQIGAVEPIIVTASKVNELHKVAISTVYPQDIIHYSLDIVDIRDIGFGNGVTVNASFKGMIYYRKDTIQNNETHYDFKNIKFRRWAVDAVAYDNGTAYVAKDVCKSGVDGKIYKCITATTGEGDPTVNTADWILWLDITADAFVSWTANKYMFYIGDINANNLIINNVTAGVDYDDFTTFGDYYNWVKDVSLGSINFELLIGYFGSATILLSQKVFKTTDDISTCYSIKFGDNNLLMTFGNNNNLITFGNNNNLITFGNSNSSMTFGNDNYSMTFGNNNILMAFGNSNSKMTFRDVTNPENKMITFGDSTTMCVFEDNCFKGLAANLDLSAATHIRGTYNTTIYQDKTNGVKLSYMDTGVMQIVDVTA